MPPMVKVRILIIFPGKVRTFALGEAVPASYQKTLSLYALLLPIRGRRVHQVESREHMRSAWDPIEGMVVFNSTLDGSNLPV